MPTKEQIVLLNKHFGACRFIYNLALEAKTMAYSGTKVNISCFELMRQVTQLKRDLKWLNQWRWHPAKSHRTFYARRTIWNKGNPVKIAMHRLILGITDVKIQCDHKDHDGLNNQRENIRKSTAMENGANRSPCGKTSKYLGVYWNKKAGKWIAHLRKMGKQIHLGSFDKETDAAKAYDKKAIELHGEFANLNFK